MFDEMGQMVCVKLPAFSISRPRGSFGQRIKSLEVIVLDSKVRFTQEVTNTCCLIGPEVEYPEFEMLTL